MAIVKAVVVVVVVAHLVAQVVIMCLGSNIDSSGGCYCLFPVVLCVSDLPSVQLMCSMQFCCVFCCIAAGGTSVW